MRKQLSLLLILVLLFSCKQEAEKEYDGSIIDREKLDATFGNDVSHVYFNHLYVVVDSLTYAKFIQDKTLSATYATIDSGLPDFDPISKNTTTCYVRGHKHYIEILGPKNRYNEPVGKSGIGFTLNNHDEHFHLGIKPKLKKDNVPFLSGSDTVKMKLHTGEETWFKAFYTPSKGTAMHTWYGFYNPSFLNNLDTVSQQTYSREQFLDQAYDEQKLFNGIHSITMLCTVKDFERIGQELRHLGQDLIDRKADTLEIASGDITLKIAHSDTIAYSHITKIECNLNTSDKSANQLGHIQIKNDGKRSIWYLYDLYKSNSSKN